jgi:hypothetical protein
MTIFGMSNVKMIFFWGDRRIKVAPCTHPEKEKFREVQNHFISVTVKVRNVP